MPVARPFKTWLTSSEIFTLRAPTRLERSDVLAGGVLRGQRRRARRDDVGEVHGPLHRFLLLAAHEKVRAQCLMGLRVDAHAAYQVVHLEALAGSDDVRHLGG